MKQIIKSMMLLAAAATAFTACNKETDIQTPEKTGEMTTIRFSAVVNDAETKATLTTEDEKTFKADWETSDKVDLEVAGGGHFSTFTATWNGSFFEFAIPSDWAEETANWAYQSYYPAKTNIPFGGDRVQNGSQYASQYDVMKSQYTTFNDSKCGYDTDGGHIVLSMTRSTSILYFHLTSELEETLASATLTVDGGDIAAETLSFNDWNVISTEGVETSNAITITFDEGTAPSAQDFCLWFNILPVEATGLTLTVTTTSGKTATLTNTKGKNYAAGKLNKIVKSGLTWEESTKYYEKVTSDEDLMNGTYLIVYETGNVAFNGGLTTLDAVSNTIEVTITDNKIESNQATDAASFTIVEGTIKSASGFYIGNTSDANALKTSATEAYENAVSFDEDGNANIVSAGSYLRYNSASNQTRFRYFKSASYTGQKAIALYLLEGSGTAPKQDPGLAFTESSYEFELGDDDYSVFNGQSLTNPHNLTVTWTSSNTNLATVDNGTVSFIENATGETTITASFEGNETYKSVSVSYTIKVTSSSVTIHTVAEAIADAAALSGETIADYYVEGIVCTTGTISSGSVSYYVSADGSSTNRFEMFKGKYIDGADFTDATNLKLGDYVVAKGTLTYYGSQAELASGNQVVSVFRAPVFSVAGGVYESAQTLTLSAEEGATIYYTIDGTTPTTSSATYSSAIAINEDMTVKAFAVKDDLSSGVVTAQYTIDANAKGTENNPYTASEAYAAAVALGSNTVENVYVKGIVSSITTAYSTSYKNVSFNISDDGLTTGNQFGAYREKSSYSSTVAAGDAVIVKGTLVYYNNTTPQLSADNAIQVLLVKPTFVSGDENFTSSTSVTLSADSGATIYYTIDGSTPTGESSVYSSAISISETTTVKAISVKDGLTTGVVSKTFTKVQAHAVTFSQPTNGTITVTHGETTLSSGDMVPANETITITATPDEGYALATLVYNDGSDHDIKSTKTFTMPSAAVSITATFEESGSVPDPETITFSTLNLTNGTQYTSPFDGGNFIVTFAGGANDGKYYTTGAAIRSYAGGTFTVSSEYTITKIELTFGSGDGSNAISVDSGTFTDPTWTGSSNSVKFTIGGTSGHRKIAAIKVTYGN